MELSTHFHVKIHLTDLDHLQTVAQQTIIFFLTFTKEDSTLQNTKYTVNDIIRWEIRLPLFASKQPDTIIG